MLLHFESQSNQSNIQKARDDGLHAIREHVMMVYMQ